MTMFPLNVAVADEGEGKLSIVVTSAWRAVPVTVDVPAGLHSPVDFLLERIGDIVRTIETADQWRRAGEALQKDGAEA